MKVSLPALILSFLLVACIDEVPFSGDTTSSDITTPSDTTSPDIALQPDTPSTDCQPQVCEPDSVTCDAIGHAIATCDSCGATTTITPCQDGQICLEGACVDGTGGCPTAVITVTEGDEVLPQTVLHLSARNSTSSTGAVTRWLWTIDQPQGSASIFFPGAQDQDITFEANNVGEYRFTLNVWDAVGTEACSPATYLVVVTSDEAIRVELLWDTPGDSNQTDTGFDRFGESTGSDMDLHFLHPNASNQYFHDTYDSNWRNNNPDWGGSGPLNNPKFTRDDTDGAGPETLLLDSPEFGATYRVGAHYWDDRIYGPSKTTIRVYIYGQLREQWANVNLVESDLWDSMTIGWPSETITRLTTPEGGPVIIPNFPHSDIFP